MSSFTEEFLNSLVISPRLVQIIRQIGEYKGKQELFRLHAPEKLENLRQVAVIQSVESSNRIEGVTASKERLEAIVLEKTTPQNRSESEIAGYRDVLATIHGNASYIPFTDSVVLQLHRDLMKYGVHQGGVWKSTQNEIEEKRPDGSKFIRFSPTSPHLTPGAMKTLHERFAEEIKTGEIEPLILTALYVLDFLCIHPFLDGNGRMSRLLSVLALYHQGYEVGRYISIEKLIEQTKESYYDALFRSSQEWHQNKHNPISWVEYWLSTVLASYRELEHRIGKMTTGHGVKADIVLQAIDKMIGSFSISQLETACPSVDRDWIKTILERLKREGVLVVSGRGRGAFWSKTGKL
jgi:Fic family protein